MRSLEGATVAVIGGAGFIGSHMVDHLINKYRCQVVVVDNFLSGRAKFVHRDATTCNIDIVTQPTMVQALLHHHKVEYVFNYAAAPYIPQGQQCPFPAYDVNAQGARNVLQVCMSLGVRGVIQISTSEVYGNKSEYKLSPDSVLSPQSVYAVGKLSADLLCQSLVHAKGLPGIVLRQFNTIGARETHPYIVPEIISQLHHGKGEVRLGNNSHRDFQCVLDAVAMAAELMEKGEFGLVYTMGSETTVGMYELAHLIGTVMNKPHVEVIIDETRKRKEEVWHLQSNNERLYKTIEYRPQYTLMQAIQQAVDYFHQNGHRWDWQ